jgi:hypothetical protein
MKTAQAPFAYKTMDISVLDLFTGDLDLQDVPAADDPDGVVGENRSIGQHVI